MKISKRPTKEGLEALAEFVANDGERDATPWELWKEGWRPRLNPTQEIAGKSKARFVLYHGGRGGSKCVQDDVIVYTETGIARMSSLRPNIEQVDNWQPANLKLVSFNGDKIVNATASGFYSEPNPDAKQIRFSNGNTLDCSPIHPLWGAYKKDGEIQFGYVSSSDLQKATENGEGFYVPLFGHPNFTSCKYIQIDHFPSSIKYPTVGDIWKTTICEEIGYLIGALVGDGGLTSYNIILSTADDEVLTRVAAAVSKLDGKVRQRTKCDYVLKGQKLQSLTRKLNMRMHSEYKRIPPEIIASPKSVLISFLRGLFDTDGTVGKDGKVSYCSASEWLSWDVQNCLQTLGIFSTRTFHPNKCAGSWLVKIYGEDARAYRDLIGFNIKRKSDRLSSIQDPGITNRNTNGFPFFILDEMRKVKSQFGSLGRRSSNYVPIVPKPTKCKKSGVFRWEVFHSIDGVYFYKSFDKFEQAQAFAKSKEQERAALPARNREWHTKHCAMLKCRYVPGPDKLKRFTNLVASSPTLEKLQISTRWVKVESVKNTTAKLVDFSVPKTNSFLANGLINHNTFGALHKLVEHCFLNDNALGLIIVGIRKQASMGGAWDKLQLEILPIWKNGNKQIANGQWTGKYYDEGIGLPFTEPTSTLDKTQIMWVGNRFGKWSCIALVSMPVDSLVIDRVKGMEPSFVLGDEAQTFESDTYFSAIIQQLGRRPGITTVQQVIYCANPEGPSHWLWKRFWEMPVDPETGEWNEHYARFFFPVEENKGNLPPDYLEINVAEAVRGDKILQQRMLEGIWVDRPSGLAMFADEFRYELCIKPAHKTAAAKGLGIIPNNKYTINFSYDLGQAHTSIDLIQIWPTAEKIWKVNFDEMDYVGQYIPYAVLVPRIIKRMLHWDNFTMADGTKIGPFKFKHISDNSAFNQLRAKDGSFDAWDIEQLSKEYVENNKPLFFQQWIKETGNPSNLTFEQWIEDDKGEYSRKYIIRMLECPKGNHSIEARVRLLKDAMQQEEYMVSATCVYKIQMLQNLEEDPKERLKPKRDRVNIHRFDSATYGLFYYGPGPGRRGLRTAQIEDTGPKFYVCGRNR